MSDYKPGTVTIRGEILEQPGASWLRVRAPGEIDYGIPVFRNAAGVDVTVEYDPEPNPVFAEGDRVKFRIPGCTATRDAAGVWACDCQWSVRYHDGKIAHHLENGLASKLDPAPKPNPEPLFKAGDRVVLKDGEHALTAKPGATATVTEDYVDGFSKWLRVEWDRTALAASQMDGGYHASDFAPYTPTLFVDGDMVTMRSGGDSVLVRIRRDGRWYWAHSGNESFVSDELIAAAMGAAPDSYWRIDTTKPQQVLS